MRNNFWYTCIIAAFTSVHVTDALPSLFKPLPAGYNNLNTPLHGFVLPDDAVYFYNRTDVYSAERKSDIEAVFDRFQQLLAEEDFQAAEKLLRLSANDPIHALNLFLFYVYLEEKDPARQIIADFAIAQKEPVLFRVADYFHRKKIFQALEAMSDSLDSRAVGKYSAVLASLHPSKPHYQRHKKYLQWQRFTERQITGDSLNSFLFHKDIYLLNLLGIKKSQVIQKLILYKNKNALDYSLLAGLYWQNNERYKAIQTYEKGFEKLGREQFSSDQFTRYIQLLLVTGKWSQVEVFIDNPPLHIELNKKNILEKLNHYKSKQNNNSSAIKVQVRPVDF